jgi:hypothetical protein
MAVFVFVTASVAVVMGLVGLVAGSMRRPARGKRDSHAVALSS